MPKTTRTERVEKEVNEYLIKHPKMFSSHKAFVSGLAKLLEQKHTRVVRMVREAVANMLWTDSDEHKEQLANLLNVRKYKDGSGYDFYRLGGYYGNVAGSVSASI